MSPLRTIALAALCLLPATLVLPGPATAAAAPTSTRTCSAAGLTYVSTDGSAVFSVSVGGLRSRGAGCGIARGVAGDVARRDLRDGRVPRTVGAWKIRSVGSCTACSPDTQVVATRGHRRITFTLLGGR